MKYFIKTSTLLVLAIILFSSADCNRDNPPPENIYSYREPIENPPDEFKISFDITQIGDKVATVKFADSSVWMIENHGDSRVLFYMENPEGDIKTVNSSVTFGLRGGVWYKFVANNNNNTDIRDFFCQLSKLVEDYDSYEPKF